MKKMDGKVFLAFGGASGMAKETALEFARNGAKVVVADISREKGEEVVDKIKQAGGEGVFVSCNVLEEEQIIAAVEFAVNHYQNLHVMLYQPGRNHVSPLVNIEKKDWDNVVNLNLSSAFLAVKYAARKMNDLDGGVILLTSSLNSTVPCNKFSVYCATKAALDMFARVAALELGPKIRVNTINPGFMNTPQIAPFTGNPEIMNLVMQHHSTSRIGQPYDFAKLALFLASDDASYITGANVIMDGGGRNFGYPDIIPIYLKSKREKEQGKA